MGARGLTGWADRHIEALGRGETVSFRPRGNSMMPRIKSGQLCTVSPCPIADLGVGDVVLCRVKGRDLLHLVKAIGHGGLVLIGNNKGHTNGWTSKVFGRLSLPEKQILTSDKGE